MSLYRDVINVGNRRRVSAIFAIMEFVKEKMIMGNQKTIPTHPFLRATSLCVQSVRIIMVKIPIFAMNTTMNFRGTKQIRQRNF